MDFLDDIHAADHAELPAGAPANVLAVGIPCRNALHFEAYVKMIEAIKELSLPMCFVVDGQLDNAADFPEHARGSVESATLWIQEMERPVREAFAGIIAATRDAGDLR